MGCCANDNIDKHFNRRKVAKKLDAYRKRGGQKTTQILVEALIAEGVSGMTLLDIGGGIGVIQHALLKAGITEAINLEASAAYIDACRQEAEKQGHANLITHIHGDFASMDDIPEADIVTLERVICCYPDMPNLVSRSSAKTKKLLGLVYPHEAWWVKLAMGILYNLKYKIGRDPFRVFIHPTKEVEAIVRSYGLECHFYKKVGPWQIAVYGRAT